MNILIVTPYNLDKKLYGSQVRTTELAKALGKHGAEVKVLHRGAAKTTNSIEFVSYSGLLDANKSYSDPVNIYFGLFNKALEQQINELLSKLAIDIIQIEQPYCFHSAYKFAKKKGITTVLDEHNMESSIIKKRNTFLLYPYVYLIEKLAVKSADHILVTSDIDLTAISNSYNVPLDKFVIVPNGVDLNRFSKLNGGNSKEKLGFNQDERIILFHGLLSWLPNYEAATLIINKIAPKLKSYTFVIIGGNAPRDLMYSCSKSSNVKYLGYVDNIQDYIIASDLCIAPILKGSGTRLKILEYMAAGKPIVATLKAIEGLKLTNGIHGFFLSKVDEVFIDVIKFVMEHDAVAEAQRSAVKGMARRFDWEKIAYELFKFYKTITEQKDYGNVLYK